MRNLILLLLLFCMASSHAQTGLLLSQTLISDWSEDPMYPSLIEDEDGKTRWKSEYAYLDSISVYSITYVSDGMRIHGFMARPKEAGKYPCIIYNRGGNREFGSLKAQHGATRLGQLARQGYIVIASQYRGNGGSEGQEEFGGNDINDILVLPEVLADIDGADTSRIGMYGWSRGGMMTYIALTKTNRIKAAVVGGALADLRQNIAERPEMESGVIAELIPNYAQNKDEELDKRSAIKWADKFPRNVPILMLHGNADWRVKPEQSLRLALAFDTYRVPYRLLILEGGDHGLTEHRKEVNEQVASWFDRYLKHDEPLPNMEYHGN